MDYITKTNKILAYRELTKITREEEKAENKALKEILKSSGEEFGQVVKSIKLLYLIELNKSLRSLFNPWNFGTDWQTGVLTLTVNNILWYYDGAKEAAVDLKTARILTPEELKDLDRTIYE